MTFEIDARDFRAAADGLDLADDIAGSDLAAALDELGADALADVRRRAGRHRRTGRLADQIRLHATGDGFGSIVTVHAGGSIAPIIAGGSRAHDIEPIRARALTVGARAGGNVVTFAARVRHPGTRGDPFVDAAMDESMDAADRDLGHVGERIADELADTIERRV